MWSLISIVTVTVLAGLLFFLWEGRRAYRSLVGSFEDFQDDFQDDVQDGSHHDEAPPLARPVETVPNLAGTAQVLFAQAEGRNFRVDCVLIGDDAEGVGQGSLLSFSLAAPSSLPLGGSLETVVEGWAEEGEIVDLELRPAAVGWRARFDDGEVKLNLEVADAVGTRDGYRF